MSTVDSVLTDLVAANRILAKENVVDGFGHVSVRHPERPDRFFMSRSRSPELVTREDIMEFDLECRPVDQRGRVVYAERPIHGCIYSARPDVHSVIHNHAHDVIPFSITNTPLRAVAHVAAPMGTDVPVWEVRKKFGDQTTLLVTTLEQGHDLAQTLGRGSAALLRGHGCVVVGETVRRAVMTAVYLMVNAKLQTTALQLGEPVYMSEGEIASMTEVAFSPVSIDRVWEYWLHRANLAEGTR